MNWFLSHEKKEMDIQTLILGGEGKFKYPVAFEKDHFKLQCFPKKILALLLIAGHGCVGGGEAKTQYKVFPTHSQL